MVVSTLKQRLQALCGQVAQYLHAMPYFPGQWRVAGFITWLSPERRVVLRDVHGFYYLVDRGNHVAHHLLRFKSVEPEVLALVPQYRCRTMIDVGANAGTFCLPASRNADVLYAVEADPDLCKMLVQTLALNRITNVIVINAAVSNTDSEFISFYRASNKKDISSLDPHNIEDVDSYEQITVPNITLDKLFRANSLQRADLIKIDAEGYSGSIIKSLRTYINHIDRIICEPSPDLDLADLAQIAPHLGVTAPLSSFQHLPSHTRDTLLFQSQ